jgi:S-adenosyl-L-methionine hydrolase (adenosine-forming)
VPAFVTLLTDFGHHDTYVGQVKGTIARAAPNVRVIDLTHEVPPHDVRTGAFLLMTSVEATPDGSVHLAIVDPGVGSARRAIALRAGRGDLLVGPDNGLLLPAAERLGGIAAAVVLSEGSWGERRSTTFHGRDLFAPVAARLALGAGLTDLGSALERPERPFVIPLPVIEGPTIRGKVLHVDLFGNLVTNIPAQALFGRFSVHVGEATVSGAPHAQYAAVPPGELLALVGSAGYLEVCAREASASLKTKARRGDPVVVVSA